MSKNDASLEEKTQEWFNHFKAFRREIEAFLPYLEKTRVFWCLNALKISRGVMLQVKISSCSGAKIRSRHARNLNADAASLA